MDLPREMTLSAVTASALAHARKDFLGQHAELVARYGPRHARPLRADYQVIDAGGPLEREHVLGALVGRTEQEAVAGQIVEGEAEVVVAGRHGAALAPLRVRLVLRAEKRRAKADRLAPRLRHENLAARGKFVWERLAVFVEGAPVDLHLADDGVDAVVWVHVPAVAQPRRTANRRIGVGADPDRWMRLLHGAAAPRGVLQREVRAGHGHDVLGPQPLHGEEVLLEAAHALLLGRAEGQVLDLAVAEGDAEDDLASAHDVGGRDLLGDVERPVEREPGQPLGDAWIWRHRRAP